MTRPRPAETTEVPVLSAEGLSLYIRAGRDLIRIVHDVTFEIGAGEIFALVGESGSGKTMIARAVMRLLPDHLLKIEGVLRFEGQDLAQRSARQMRRLRGGPISMIFQEPMTSLNPLMTVGRQIDEALAVHSDLSRRARRDRIGQLLADVRFGRPEEVAGMYPHELSGGMRQRAMIAMALANEPRLLIADEPTTALDVTIQQEVMEILLRLREKYRLSVLFISHDLSLVHRYAERIGVLYGGVLMETGRREDVIGRAAHPYTEALLSCAPRRRIGGARQVGIEGTVPQPTDWWSGCRFAPRCPYRGDDCMGQDIIMNHRPDGRAVRCVRPRQ